MRTVGAFYDRALIERAYRHLVLFVLLVFLPSCTRAIPAKPGEPKTIVSIVPSVTEMLFEIGVGDRVIGVSNFDNFPPEVQIRQRVGGLIDPDTEKIISMHPDLVITYGTQDALQQHLQAVGIRLLPYVHGNIEQTLQFTVELGNVTGASEQAEKLVQRLRTTFDRVRARAPAVKPKVLLLYGREAGALGGFYSAGKKSFQNDLIEIAGGTNLFGDIDQETAQPSLEEVISRKPDVIVETLTPPVDPAEIVQRKTDWDKLGLAKGRIYIESEPYFLLPGPRLGMAAQRMSEILNGH